MLYPATLHRTIFEAERLDQDPAQCQDRVGLQNSKSLDCHIHPAPVLTWLRYEAQPSPDLVEGRAGSPSGAVSAGARHWVVRLGMQRAGEPNRACRKRFY